MDDPKIQELHDRIREIRDELHEHAQLVDDPKCAALCETSAEVINGVETSFDHFMDKSKPVWQ